MDELELSWWWLIPAVWLGGGAGWAWGLLWRWGRQQQPGGGGHERSSKQ